MGERGRWLFVVVLLLVLAAAVWGVYTFKSEPYPGANDFYSRWSGVASFWIDGLNPYGDEASLAIQIGIYGRPVIEGEDPGYFAYPFYTVFLFAPLGVLPYAWAEAIWLALLAASLIGALALLLDAYGWRPGPLMLGVLVLWTLFFYPSARGMLLGQPGLVVYFLEVLALWALCRGRPVLAGVALAVSTIKPQMGFLFVPLLLLWGLRAQRWRFVGAFVVAWGGMMLLSFLVLPSWLSEWLAQVSLYPSYTLVGSPLWVLTRLYLPFLGPTGEGVISAALLALLGWAWWRVIWQRRLDEFAWAVALALTITHIIALRTASPHFVVFIVPLVFYFQQLVREDRRRGPWVVLVILSVVTVGYWALFLLTMIGKLEHPVTYLPLPFGVLVTLLISRGLWQRRAPLVPAGQASAQEAAA